MLICAVKNAIKQHRKLKLSYVSLSVHYFVLWDLGDASSSAGENDICSHQSRSVGSKCTKMRLRQG